MEEPLRKNIDGAKKVTHSVNHKVNWGHVALGVAVVVVAVKFGPPIVRSASSGEEEEADPFGN